MVIGHDDGGEEDVDEGGFEEDDPAEVHELIKAEAGDGPADEDEEEDEEGDLRQEAADVDEADPPGTHGEHLVDAEADGPSAKEEGDDDGGADDHGGVFAEEEESELHGGVFGVVAADEFGFALGRSKGMRLVSAKMEVVKMKKAMPRGMRRSQRSMERPSPQKGARSHPFSA